MINEATLVTQIELVPYGWTTTLKECPPGHFFYKGTVAFKSEYGDIECFVVDSGEYFWGGTKTKTDLGKLIVQPLSCDIEIRRHR